MLLRPRLLLIHPCLLLLLLQDQLLLRSRCSRCDLKHHVRHALLLPCCCGCQQEHHQQLLLLQYQRS
jgi:hypothetical protein